MKMIFHQIDPMVIKFVILEFSSGEGRSSSKKDQI